MDKSTIVKLQFLDLEDLNWRCYQTFYVGLSKIKKEGSVSLCLKLAPENFTCQDMDPREMLQRHQERPKNPVMFHQPRQHGFKQVRPKFVTGPPKKDHWKPDYMANECSLCGQQFGIFIRRHHCRKCGEIYCHACCKVAYIDTECSQTRSRFTVPSSRNIESSLRSVLQGFTGG
jgi:hypothetical protein